MSPSKTNDVIQMITLSILYFLNWRKEAWSKLLPQGRLTLEDDKRTGNINKSGGEQYPYGGNNLAKTFWQKELWCSPWLMLPLLHCSKQWWWPVATFHSWHSNGSASMTQRNNRTERKCWNGQTKVDLCWVYKSFLRALNSSEL